MLESDSTSDSITGDEDCPKPVVLVTGNLTLCGLLPENLLRFRVNFEVWVKTGGIGVGGVLTGFTTNGGDGFMVGGKGTVVAWKKWTLYQS